MTPTPISVAKAKSHISELIAKSQYSHERFIITQRDKPVAALVSLDDPKILEQYEEKRGLVWMVLKTRLILTKGMAFVHHLMLVA